MGEKRLKISITKKCEICGNEFQAWYKKTKSCSKVCKNELARKITQKQFSTLESRKNHSSITKKAMDNPNIRKNFEIGMSAIFLLLFFKSWFTGITIQFTFKSIITF